MSRVAIKEGADDAVQGPDGIYVTLFTAIAATEREGGWNIHILCS